MNRPLTPEAQRFWADALKRLEVEEALRRKEHRQAFEALVITWSILWCTVLLTIWFLWRVVW